jgi:hypothetical protein
MLVIGKYFLIIIETKLMMGGVGNGVILVITTHVSFHGRTLVLNSGHGFLIHI